MGDRPSSDPGTGQAGRGDPESPDEQTIRLDPRPARESHSSGDSAPGAPAGQPSDLRDANIRDVSASIPQGPHPSTEGVKRFLHFAAQLRPQIQKMKLREVLRGKLSRAVATARRRERARARWADALQRVSAALRQAVGRRTARTSARPATLVATAGSLDRAAAPVRPRERGRAPPRRPQLRRAALCGPVLLHIVDAYEVYAALGDG